MENEKTGSLNVDVSSGRSWDEFLLYSIPSGRVPDWVLQRRNEIKGMSDVSDVNSDSLVSQVGIEP